MSKMIEPQGVPYKTLRGNPFETHKIDPYYWSYDSIQNILTTSVL
jgi:hypothetical protein